MGMTLYKVRRRTYITTYTLRSTCVGQVTIYLDEETERTARAAAESDGLSLSKWIAHRIEKDARAEWPATVRKLAGAWPDLPSVEQIRRHVAKDVARRRL